MLAILKIIATTLLVVLRVKRQFVDPAKEDLRERRMTLGDAIGRAPISKVSILLVLAALIGAIVLIYLAATTPMPQ